MLDNKATPDEALAGTETDKVISPISLTEQLSKDGRDVMILGALPGDFSHLNLTVPFVPSVIGIDVGNSIGDSSCVVNAPPFFVDQGITHTNNKTVVLPTNHEMCAEINALAGNVVDQSQSTMVAQKKIIECEWNEMCSSVEAGDLEQLRDDVQDMLFTVYGMAARMGFPADLDFKAVCDSQYSKFDVSVDDVLKTQAKYLALGVETYYESKFRQDETKVYVTYSAKDQTGTDNKSYPAGKWLKSVNFKDPVYTPLS